MWGTIISFLGSKVFSKSGVVIIPLLIIMAVIIVPNTSAILEKFGVVTRASLQKEITRLSGEVDTYKEAVDKLTKENAFLVSKTGISAEAIEAACRIDQAVDREVEVLIKDREGALKEFNDALKRSSLVAAPMPVSAVEEVSVVKVEVSRSKAPTRQQVDTLSSYNYDSIVAAHSSFFKE